jgi:hypothetical protein
MHGPAVIGAKTFENSLDELCVIRKGILDKKPSLYNGGFLHMGQK